MSVDAISAPPALPSVPAPVSVPFDKTADTIRKLHRVHQRRKDLTRQLALLDESEEMFRAGLTSPEDSASSPSRGEADPLVRQQIAATLASEQYAQGAAVKLGRAHTLPPSMALLCADVHAELRRDAVRAVPDRSLRTSPEPASAEKSDRAQFKEPKRRSKAAASAKRPKSVEATCP